MNTSTRKLQSLIWVVLVGLGVVAANCGPSGNDGGGRSGTPFDPNANAGANGRGGAGGFGASGAGARDGGPGDTDADPFVIDFPDALAMKDAPGTGGEEKKDTRELCGAAAFVVERVPPDLMIVLDRSGSMMRLTNGEGPAPNMSIRWKYTTTALNTVMTATDGDVAWGLKMYPSCTPGAGQYECVPNACATTLPVPLLEEPDLGRAAALNQLILQKTPKIDVGATPTAPAVDEAVAALKTRNNGRPKYILLATDGAPNCAVDPVTMVRRDSLEDSAGAVKAVADAKAANIDVFVLGIAIANPAATTDPLLLKAHQTLNMMAEAGGRARMGDVKYYPATNEDDIKKAVSEIAAATVSCTLPLAQEPRADASARVDIDKVLVQEGATEGWSFGPDRKSITLNGSYCTKRKSGELKKIIISFDCPGKIPPPPPLAL